MNKKAFEGSFLCSASVGNWNEWIDVGFDFSELIILVNYSNQYITMTYKDGHFYWVGYTAGVIVDDMIDDYFEKSDTQFRLKTPAGGWTGFELPYIAVADIPVLPPLPVSKLIFDGKVYGSVIYGGDDMIDYSTEEQKTGQKWIDGRDLYQKTVYLGAMPNNERKEIAHGVNDIDFAIKAEGFAIKDNSHQTIILSYVPAGSNTTGEICLFVDGPNVVLVSNYDRRNYSGYVTITYVKIEQ